MVLLINHSCLEKCPESTRSLFNQHPILVSRANEWRRQPPITVPDNGTLYVGQREFAVVPGYDDRVLYVGSEDATTCHVVIFRHKQTASVAVAHFDGGKHEETVIAYIVQTLLKNSTDRMVDVYAVGGFYKESLHVKGVRESQKLSLKLLSVLIKLDCNINLIQWCCCELNTLEINGTIRPYFHGLCWNRSTINAQPAIFESHGLDSALRSASSWATHSDNMTNLYDSSTHTITIQPFQNDDSDHWNLYKKLPDEVILNHFSTSPSAEPSHFCAQMRYQFSLLADNPKPSQTLFLQGPRVYVLQESGVWKLNE